MSEPLGDDRRLALLDDWAHALEELGEAVALRRDWLAISDLMLREASAWLELRHHVAESKMRTATGEAGTGADPEPQAPGRGRPLRPAAHG